MTECLSPSVKNLAQRLPLKFAMIIGFLLVVMLTACGASEADREAIDAAWESSAHADKESRAFSRWNDEDPPEIPTRCAKCHSTTGYLDFLGADGSPAGEVTQPAPVGTTVECDACHNDVSRSKDSALMPSGVTLTALGGAANCFECHQGRASTKSVSEAVDGKAADTVDSELSLPNIHNNPAGPTQHGSEAMGGFEFANRTYAGFYLHTADFNTCYECHNAHNLQVEAEKCSACHLGANTQADLANIRTNNIDYDGDGDIQEGMSGEIETMADRLLLAMRIYAATTEGAAELEHDGRFVDSAGESYATWTPRLLQAAYNYQYVTIDGGGYAHNAPYLLQLLFDSIEDIGGETAGMTRP